MVPSMKHVLLPLAVSVFYANAALSADMTSEDAVELQNVYITGGANELLTQPGSATLIDDVALEQFEYTDIHRVLNAVPGVNLQEEDGYGLRPNIGMRGTAPERSKKVTIMEDGVLSGPAPYSAPAAYYFPNVSRMSAVEVFKGPSAIQYGPATIAGAINLVSRPIPYAAEGELDIQYGQFNFQRYNAYYGQQIGQFGFLLEALNVSTDGFKDLPDDSDTGFERNDFTLKTSYDINGPYNQYVQLKLGYADETSNETYVGLTRDDFDADPYQRYAASQLDKMEWEHTQIHFTHSIEPSLSTQITTDVYQNTFSRDWFKLNGFNGSNVSSVDEILQNPTAGSNNAYYEVLTGERDSTGAATMLLVGNNGRTFVSQGIQSRLNTAFMMAGLPNDLEVGVRYHMDEIERDHTEQAYNMVSGELVAGSAPIYSTKINKGEAQALAVYVKNDIEINGTTVTLGLRNEQIETKLTENGVTKTANETALLPGMGVYSQITDSFGVLAGVYKGFTATSPGQEGDIDPEESLNYEAGFRVLGDHQVEVIGFVNDYSNLKGTCSFNNGCSGSDLDTEANAGEVLVYGLESSYKYEHTLGALTLPVQVTYTYTKSEFESEFTDGSGVFTAPNSKVEVGDELAYLPQHRFNVKAGLQHDLWSLQLSMLYQSEMRNEAGQGSIPEDEKIDAYTVLDVSAFYQVHPSVQVYSTIDNLMNKDYMVAGQPMGYRPGKPRAIHAGVKVGF